ncbi:MAG: hypothetical protein AB7K24_28285 [Gemmataceae bacterium]
MSTLCLLFLYVPVDLGEPLAPPVPELAEIRLQGNHLLIPYQVAQKVPVTTTELVEANGRKQAVQVLAHQTVMTRHWRQISLDNVKILRDGQPITRQQLAALLTKGTPVAVVRAKDFDQRQSKIAKPGTLLVVVAEPDNANAPRPEPTPPERSAPAEQ